ncbi:MAG: polyprenyl synthetase family protein [Anaerolineaceae bacterium]|nr:polyprenyl synthetase family protein [Anaerolineaceae bacterium]
MELVQAFEVFGPKIEYELKTIILDTVSDEYPVLREMLTYHMGWEGEGAGPHAQGKRIRPVLLLLNVVAAGGNWEQALPAAAGVELLHNFSLIHDDVQDQGDRRHGRSTVWVKWGIPQAINAGDLMFTISNIAVLRLKQFYSPKVVLKAQELFQRTCVKLTQGQFLDMWYEELDELPFDAYWSMVAGKTAALLACCTEMGGLLGGANAEACEKFHNFGDLLGMAFQAQDDLLGIWGDSEKIGKSTSSDIYTKKKTLPVLFGLKQNGKFAERWLSGNFGVEDVPELALLLEKEGGREYTEQIAVDLTRKAVNALEKVADNCSDGIALQQLMDQLIGRQV